MQQSSIWPQTFAAFSASLIFVCYGYHYEWSVVSIERLILRTSDFEVRLDQFSWIIALLFIGAIFGALLSIVLVDQLGRRMTLLNMTIPLFASCALITAARNYWWLYLARFIAGLGVGVSFAVGPMYIGEIAEGRMRGGLCILMPVMACIGRILVQVISPWVGGTALGIVGGIIPVVFATALLWAPESPYYYAMKRRSHEVQKSVAWLRGTPDVHQEVQQIQNSIGFVQRNSGNFMHLFTIQSNQKAFLIVMGLFTCQLLSGFTAVMFHSGEIFHTLFSVLGIRFPTSMVEIIITFISTIWVAFMVDKVGRRTLLLASSTLSVVFLLAEALYFQLEGNGSHDSRVPWLAGVALIGYLLSSSMGVRTIPVVISGEIFPCEVKGFALGISTAYSFAVIVGLGSLWSFMIDAISYHIILYATAACNIAITFFIYFAVPEMKGSSLSEIQTSRNGHSKIQQQF